MSRRRSILSRLAVCCMAMSCFDTSSPRAATFDGRHFDDARTVAGETVVLNGVGKRVVMVLDVYYASLYLPQPRTEFTEVRRSMRRRFDLEWLRDVKYADVEAVLREGISRNTAAAEVATLQPRIDRMQDALRRRGTFRRGDILQVVFDGEATRLLIGGADLMPPIEGKDFNDALMAIWLGANPVDAVLKQQLLSGASRTR